jgi:hypothetical protein
VKARCVVVAGSTAGMACTEDQYAHACFRVFTSYYVCRLCLIARMYALSDSSYSKLITCITSLSLGLRECRVTSGLVPRSILGSEPVSSVEDLGLWRSFDSEHLAVFDDRDLGFHGAPPIRDDAYGVGMQVSDSGLVHHTGSTNLSDLNVDRTQITKPADQRMSGGRSPVWRRNRLRRCRLKFKSRALDLLNEQPHVHRGPAIAFQRPVCRCLARSRVGA